MSLVSATVMFGQRVITDVDKMEILKTIPEESIFIHKNASTLFSGEKLYYKIYCLNTENNLLSAVSKIGYVELVGPDKRSIFKHKIKLVDGLGQGDFFIPADILTAKYKLVGYTSWMKNNQENQYFISDIDIVNLYNSNSNFFTVKKDSVPIDSLNSNNFNPTKKGSQSKDVTSKYLQLVLNKKKYKNREEVRLNIKNLLGKNGFGNYSISVIKKDEIIDSKIDAQKPTLSIKLSNTDNFYLPELRGTLLSGRIVANIKNANLKNKKVSISVPGKDFLFKLASTNLYGEFYFNLPEQYDSETIFVQIFEKDRDAYTIEFADNSIDYNKLAFSKLTISKDKKELIQQRNIHTQIENAYLAAKQDTLETSITTSMPFYKDFEQVYMLDDYTRFSTIEETLIEIIEDVRLKKDEKGDSFFRVKGNEYFTYSDMLPLVIVDGVLLQNHSDLLGVSARKIKKISVARSDYEFALQSFRGIIVFDTFDGVIEGLFDKEFIKKIDFSAPPLIKKYFKTTYNSNSEIDRNRVPDYRYQLLWLPNLTLNEHMENVEFFTSDVNGEYEISLRGFTLGGKSISIQETFEVD